MTPKEEAEELVKSFIGLNSKKLSDYSRIEFPTAKQCALIAVEFAQERVNDVADNIFLDSTDATNDEWNYLEEVKQEIQKL